MSTLSTLLVTGAGGKLGRRVIELLLETGAGPVIATSRSPDQLADLAGRGVELRRADFDDPAGLARAFAGADRLLLVSTDALDRPGRRLAQHRAAIAAAEQAGVRHLVYTSAPGPQPTAEPSLISDHFWTEQVLAASRLDWTILRNNLYAEIALLALSHALASGQLVSAAGDGRRAYVTREDCAAAAAAALRGGTGRRILEISGPAAITQDELAGIAGEVAGRPLAHVRVTSEGLRQGLRAAGLPPLLADGLVDFDLAAAEGRHAVVTTAVRDLTGRLPTGLAAFLAEHRSGLQAANR